MSHSVKIYTFESIQKPQVTDHPKARVVLTVDMQAAGMEFQWCCRPMDMEKLPEVLNSKIGKGWMWNECRWCGSVWELTESTDGNNETFYQYKEHAAPPPTPEPEWKIEYDYADVPQKKVMLPSPQEIGKYDPYAKANIAMPKSFSVGIRCPNCEGIIQKHANGNYGCNKCKFGHEKLDPQHPFMVTDIYCKKCSHGKMRATGDNYYRLQCDICGVQSEHV